MRGLQDYHPDETPWFYAGNGSYFARIDPEAGSYSSLASPPGDLAAWGSPSLALDDLWEIRSTNIYRYDTDTGTWSTPRTDLVSCEDELAMTITDEDGNLWSYQGCGMLVRYNPDLDFVEYFDTFITTYDFETRLGFDRATNSIFFGGFGDNIMHQYEIDTGVTTRKADHPEDMLNDIFCSDRSGHIYAAGGSGGSSLYQYSVALDTWYPMVDFGIDHGNNGSCMVSDAGWLYMEPGDLSSLHRLPLY
jgi:streptogramin lyase